MTRLFRAAPNLCALLMTVPYGLAMACVCFLGASAALFPWGGPCSPTEPRTQRYDETRWIRRQADTISTN